MIRTALALILVVPMLSFGHEVPDEVRIRAFLKPSDGRMTILVRIPANALIDTLFPMLANSPWVDLKRAKEFAEDGARTWVADLIHIYEDDKELPVPRVMAVCVTQMPDGDFSSYQKASSHISRCEWDDNARFTQDEAAVDVELQVPIHAPFSNFSAETGFGRVGVRVTTSLAFLPANRGIRQFEFEGNAEKFHLDPSRSDAFLRSVRDGYRHFFTANDYWLFLACLALLMRNISQLIRFAIPMFVSQSLAFLGAAFGLWISSPWAEPCWGVLVAAVVVYIAFEAIVGQANSKTQLIASLVGGFVFGTGYWFAFRPQMQFGGEHKFVSVIAFASGIQVTQVLFLAAAVAAIALLWRMVRYPSVFAIIAAAFVLRISWHAMLDRARVLKASTVAWPIITPTVIMSVASLLALAFLATIIRRKRQGQLQAGAVQ